MKNIFTDTDTMEYCGLDMSNYDHSIDEGLADALKKKPNQVYGKYPAWNFFAIVWYNGKDFSCQIMQYHVIVEEFEKPTLHDIVDYASEKYGYE